MKSSIHLPTTEALYSLGKALNRRKIRTYSYDEDPYVKNLHRDFFKYLDQLANLSVHSFNKKPSKGKVEVSIKGFGANGLGANSEYRLKKLHNGFYSATLKSEQLLQQSRPSPIQTDYSLKHQQTKNLETLLNFIMNRESAKPWFDYHKLLLERGLIRFNEKDLGKIRSKSGLSEVVEFSQKPQSAEQFINFLKLLKSETLEKINHQYDFKDLMKVADASSFKILSDEYIQKFKNEIKQLSPQLQIDFFKNLVDTHLYLENNKANSSTILQKLDPELQEKQNNLSLIIELFTKTLKHSPTESFSESVKNNDLGKLLNHISGFKLDKAHRELYNLALIGEKLSYSQFNEYAEILKNLVLDSNNTGNLKILLERSLAPKDSALVSEAERSSISLLKKLNDIFGLENLNSSDPFKQPFRAIELDPKPNESLNISQQDIKSWLEKMEENFDISQESSKKDIADFINQALRDKDSKNHFIQSIKKQKYNEINLNLNLFQASNLNEANKLSQSIYADSPPYSHNDKYENSMKAAHRVANGGINQSQSFWSLAWLARNIPQSINEQLEAIARTNLNAMGHKSTLEEFAEQLSLKPYQLISSEKAQDYPGTGLIINGLKLPQAFGFQDVSDNDIEAKNIYRQWINSVESLVSADPKNSGYLQNRHDLSGINQDAEKSRFILTRGFIAITPPEKLMYGIRCSETEYEAKDKYPDYIFSDKNFTQKNGTVLDFTPDHKLHKTSRWNIVPEHFSLIVFNDHFGNREKHPMSYLVPTKVLNKALENSIHPDSKSREFSSADNKYLDFTNAKMSLKDLAIVAKEMKLPLLDLTSSSNIGSLANSFPKGWKTYHDWENDLDERAPHESKDRIKAHYHKTHYRGRGYERDLKPYMNLIYPLQEAENNIDHVASRLQGINKLFMLSLNSFINGSSFIESEKLGIKSLSRNDSEPNAHYMLNKAYKINRSFSALKKPKEDYPVLVKQDDFTRLSHLPAKYPHLDTYDMMIRSLDESGKVIEQRLNSDPNHPATLDLFLESFMNNINPDNTLDVFKGVHFMPRHIAFTKPTFTKKYYTEIIQPEKRSPNA